MEPETSYDLPSESWRPRKVCRAVPLQTWRPKNQGVKDVGLSLSTKARELGPLMSKGRGRWMPNSDRKGGDGRRREEKKRDKRVGDERRREGRRRKERQRQIETETETQTEADAFMGYYEKKENSLTFLFHLGLNSLADACLHW
jgi:hypothetical protein